MKVYVLLGVTHFEGETLLGVYSSQEKAVAEMKEYDSMLGGYDDYQTAEVEIDKPAMTYP